MSQSAELEFAWKLAANRRKLIDQLRRELMTSKSNEMYYRKLLEKNGIEVK